MQDVYILLMVFPGSLLDLEDGTERDSEHIQGCFRSFEAARQYAEGHLCDEPPTWGPAVIRITETTTEPSDWRWIGTCRDDETTQYRIERHEVREVVAGVVA